MTRYIIKPWYTKPKKTMTIILNLNNSSVANWATYSDDATEMQEGSDDWDDFFGHYPCILNNGVELGKLKRDNFTQYEDGTSAPITTLGNDVMIAFPRRGIKIEYLDNTQLLVSMTNEYNKEGYSYMAHTYSNSGANLSNVACDKFYLGAYKGYVQSNKLYSTSGISPTVEKTIGEFRTCAQGRGAYYEQSSFFQLTFRQVMYLLKYKGKNSQTRIGMGLCDSDAKANTGNMNTKGMDWGESTGKIQMKLFGIEDFYGNIWEYMDGIYSDSNRRLYVANGNFNDSGTNYISAGTPAFNSNVNGYLRFPNGTSLSGFTAGSTSYGNYDTYFCDNAYTVDSSLGICGGSWSNGVSTGVFRSGVSRKPSDKYNYIGARLMYMKISS